MELSRVSYCAMAVFACPPQARLRDLGSDRSLDRRPRHRPAGSGHDAAWFCVSRMMWWC